MRKRISLKTHKSNYLYLNTASPSRKSGKLSRKNVIAFLTAGIMLLAVLLVTLNGNLFETDLFPTWSQLYGGTGLSGTASSVTSDVSVHFIDVGQGDCELIKTKEKTVLIDSGEKDCYETVIDYIKSQGIARLDYVIITHPHSDHAGSMSYILNEFEIGTVILPKLSGNVIPTTSTYTDILEVIDENGINVMYAKQGTDIELGESTLEILAPVGDYENLNDWSVVAKFIHGENSFLFTGDIEEAAEDDILDSGCDISADVIKVAHHGSSTSSKKKFLKAVNPQFAVIEVGSPNTYNHPNEAVLEKIIKLGIEIYRTDLNGNIIFESDGKNIAVTVEKAKA